MFFSQGAVLQAIDNLKKVHPFFGMTFLVCKKNQLPVGSSITFPLDAETKKFLEHIHKITPESTFFFQPFKSVNAWLKHDYASSGLQSVNTRSFPNAFIHPKNSKMWGWRDDYLTELASHASIKKNKIPLLSLCIWVYKYNDFHKNISYDEILSSFISEFHLTDEELITLFDHEEIPPTNLFSNECISWHQIKSKLSLPPDSQPENGGTLSLLSIVNIGPAKSLKIEPKPRLNIITGDNGLGKSFILESAWWALTNSWTDRVAYPDPRLRGESISLTYSIKSDLNYKEDNTVNYDWNNFCWPIQKDRPTIPGLIVYGKVDGSFAIWDPARKYSSQSSFDEKEKAVFTSEEIWNGQEGILEGLIRDWITWQNDAKSQHFSHFQRVLQKLSPPDLGILKPGQPVRIPDDPRIIPTLIHPYGEIPITNASAGVRRIVALAYMIVWAWNEHQIISQMLNIPPQNNMVVLVDELEAHLHPKWQRAFLPSLMELNQIFSNELKIQFIIATHSPLVMASSEEVFDSDTDCLFHLQLDEDGKISLEELDFIKYGDISSWLMSPIFELRQARSQEGESAIEDAKKLQNASNPDIKMIEEVSLRLRKYLSASDRFWPRWMMFAEKNGVYI
ncbi:AAA family ATPase [Photorhabdus sp. RM323S]|uniref:AAA family ATPase n=1 Tax=Photorhabdus sp. RM323S TaxID=3342828 RepID=UPI0036DBE903